MHLLESGEFLNVGLFVECIVVMKGTVVLFFLNACCVSFLFDIFMHVFFCFFFDIKGTLFPFFFFLFFFYYFFFGEVVLFLWLVFKLFFDDGVQDGKDSKTHHFINFLVLGHLHEPTESKYGLRFA